MGKKSIDELENTTLPCSRATYNDLLQIRTKLTLFRKEAVTWDETLRYVLSQIKEP